MPLSLARRLTTFVSPFKNSSCVRGFTMGRKWLYTLRMIPHANMSFYPGYYPLCFTRICLSVVFWVENFFFVLLLGDDRCVCFSHPLLFFVFFAQEYIFTSPFLFFPFPSVFARNPHQASPQSDRSREQTGDIAAQRRLFDTIGKKLHIKEVGRIKRDKFRKSKKKSKKQKRAKREKEENI